MIEEKIDSLIFRFNRFNEWEERYKYLIDLGKDMKEMDVKNKISENLVKGCQSLVWLHADLKEGKIYFEGDSDASIVKGLVALLLAVYSGATPDEILNTKPIFLEKIGLREHLSMSRANGLNSMMKQIYFFAMAFKAKLNVN